MLTLHPPLPFPSFLPPITAPPHTRWRTVLLWRAAFYSRYHYGASLVLSETNLVFKSIISASCWRVKLFRRVVLEFKHLTWARSRLPFCPSACLLVTAASLLSHRRVLAFAFRV